MGGQNCTNKTHPNIQNQKSQHIVSTLFEKKKTSNMKFKSAGFALFAIFNNFASAVNSDIAWGTHQQIIPGYTEITSHFLKTHAAYFDNHYKNHGFVGKATHAPDDCAVILADGAALQFENGSWLRLARSKGCIFNWASGKYCKNTGGTGIRYDHHQPEIVNYAALITFGYNNNDCKNRSKMSAKKIFQKLKYVSSGGDAHSIFIKNTLMVKLAMG